MSVRFKVAKNVSSSVTDIVFCGVIFRSTFMVGSESPLSFVMSSLSSTSAKIAQGEVLQLQHKGEADLLEETYIDIINLKTASLFAAATKSGACLSGTNENI